MIAEAYALMREGLGIEPQAQSEIFKQWNEGELDSYLIEITWRYPRQDRRRNRPANGRMSYSTRPAKRARASGPASTRCNWALQ